MSDRFNPIPLPYADKIANTTPEVTIKNTPRADLTVFTYGVPLSDDRVMTVIQERYGDEVSSKVLLDGNQIEIAESGRSQTMNFESKGIKYSYTNSADKVEYKAFENRSINISREEFYNELKNKFGATDQNWAQNLDKTLPQPTVPPTHIPTVEELLQSETVNGAARKYPQYTPQIQITQNDTLKITTDSVCAVVSSSNMGQGVQDYKGDKVLGNYCDNELAPSIKNGKAIPPVNIEKLNIKATTYMGAGGQHSEYDIKKIEALRNSLPPNILKQVAEAAKGGTNLIINEVWSEANRPLQNHFVAVKPTNKQTLGINN